jgi:superfamily I DNA and/or RNA helicase/very-short-patch-repair endonuclease
MQLTEKFLSELQSRLKIGNRRGVHLNAIPSNSRYKFDLNRLSYIDKNLPDNFIKALLSERPLKFRISWKENVPDLNSLYEEEQTQLVRITKAFENLINQTEAIESEKGINTFGFGYPILAKRDRADNKLTVAPVLIWSLRIKRTKEFNTWEILRNEDDPIYINEVLINHLQNDVNVKIEQIPSEMLDDGLIEKDELIKICANLIRSVNSSSPSDLEEIFKCKLDKVVSIGDKAHYEELPLNSSNSMIDFGGLFSIFEVQKQNIINDYSYLMDLKGINIPLEDLEGNSFQSISSVETDPSQQSILHALESTRNILIQGPPGTGKSQTLTAILINALENNKKTLVVCEKRTALEVLHNALIEKGLNYNCVLIRDIVKDRKTVVDSVRDRVDASDYKRLTYNYSKDSLDSLINKVKELITGINNKHQKLDTKIMGDKTWSDVVGDLLAELRKGVEDSGLNIEKSSFNYSTQELNTLIELVKNGQTLYSDYKQIESTSFINSLKLVGENPYQIEQSINKDFEIYSKLLEEIRILLEPTRTEFISVRKNSFQRQLKNVSSIFNEIDAILIANQSNVELLDELKLNSFFYKLSSFFSNEKKYTINAYKALQVLFNTLSSTIKNTPDLPVENFNKSLVLNKVLLVNYKNKLEEISLKFDANLDNEFRELTLLKLNPIALEVKYAALLKDKLSYLADKIYKDSWTHENIKFTELYKFITEVELLIQKKIEYFDTEKDVFTIEFKWFQFFNNLTDNQKLVINELKSKNNWSKSFLQFYLNSLLLYTSNVDLPTNDDEHIQLDNTLNNVEKEQLSFIKQFWYSKQIDATKDFEKKNVNLSVENLYNKRSSSRFKRLALRQIVQYDANLFTNFFPIILTSPDVASNLFKGMNGYFDIVMFDEASQLRVEDNLPAILKGKQIVIAGDEHQMPPSNYFSKVFDGTIEDEEDLEEENQIIVDKDNILLSCESLLDFGSELNFQRKHLDFHYRSRHPFLIDFSNFAFYNQRLKPLPNNFDYIPIKYIQVDGIYSEHTNEAEAEMVLSIIEKNINRLPNGEYPTVGIATFNITQRNLIKSKILERQKFSKFKDFNEKIQDLEDNGLFVKNLENIQGDERDVIILSTTYGIGKDGKFAQRFGPVNHSKGYKLLNVIVTRAKYKVYCCSSIPEQVFMNFKDYLLAEGSNNKKAVFYAYLAYCKAVSESNNDLRLSVLTALADNTSKHSGYDSFTRSDLESPFEEEVYQRLVNHLGTEKLVPKVQFAGFKIDIVYDPQIIGIPKIAIECDGSKYHSSREAYLYDRHRQIILEKYGFVFHRIWSTNWWRNANRETTKLVEFIKNIESTLNPNFKDYSHTASAFTDDIIVNLIPSTSFVNSENVTEVNSVIENVAPIETKSFKDIIKLNSEVKVRYVNNGMNIILRIVSHDDNLNEKLDGIQKIDCNSTLAHSLLGHSVGDIVKIGSLDNYVEIVDIKNALD